MKFLFLNSEHTKCTSHPVVGMYECLYGLECSPHFMTSYHFIWFKQQHVKWQSEGNHQQQSQNGYLEKGKYHIPKHKKVDSSHRPFQEKHCQFNPPQEYSYRSSLPLPAVNTQTGGGKYKCEYYGRSIKYRFLQVGPAK